MSDTPPPPLKPIPIKDRNSMIFLQYGQIDVVDGAFLLIDQTGVRMHIAGIHVVKRIGMD